MYFNFYRFIAGSSLLSCNVQQRHISVSASLLGKRNLRKFFLGNKRGTKLFRRDQALGKYDDIAPIYSKLKICVSYLEHVYMYYQENNGLINCSVVY